MAWFGSVRSFHSRCLNSLAASLVRSGDIPWEKVQLLLDYCPSVSIGSKQQPSTVLHDRGLSAVVALGYFAVESKLQHHGDKIMEYLLQLFHALPVARWIQNTEVAAKRDGLIAEQFCYKLGVILGAVSNLSPEHHDKVAAAQLDVFEAFVKKFLEILTIGSEELCLVTAPALLGLSRALHGSPHSSTEAFWALMGSDVSAKNSEANAGVSSYGVGETETLFKLIIDVLNPLNLKTVDSKLEEIDDPSYPHRFLSHLIQCKFILLLRDIVTTHKDGLGTGMREQVLKLAEDLITGGARELSSSGPSSAANEKAIHIIRSMGAAVELLTWAVEEDAEIESAFQRLSSLLTVHTSKFSVLVTSLRARILEGITALVEKYPALTSSALNRFREFLNSTLLHGMYCDALASGDVDFATSVPPQSIKKLLSCSASPVHISRIDAFATVMQALANAVCRTLLVGSKHTPECVAAFLALGNKLYTTDAADVRALRTAECIVMLLGLVAVTMGEQHNVISTVVAIFQQRLFHPASSLDGNIVIELGKMAAKNEHHGTLEVLSRLMTQSLGDHKEAASYNHIYQPVMNSLLHVAQHLQDTEQRYELMLKALQLFVQQGIEAKRASERADAQTSHKATSSSFSLGLLLPVIATLVQKLEPIKNPTQKEVKLFRDFWFYCIVMGFSEAEMGVFPPLWYKSVREIASKSPLLLSMGAEQYLHKELELSHPLQIENITPGELLEVRQNLLDQLGRSTELDKLVYRLTFVQCMYLQSIYRLESLRLEKDTNSFELIFCYLEDKGLHGELWVAVEMIANKLFLQFLDQMKAKPADSARTEELESYTQLLVFKFSHLRGRIKQVADRYLTKLVDKFSHLLWSKRVILTMLDLLHEVSLTLHRMEPSERQAVEVKLPYLPHTIAMPESIQKREKTMSYFATRCEQILELAIKWAPDQIKAILENYICQLGAASTGMEHHSGVSLATTQLNKHFEFNDRSKHLPTAVTSSRPTCVKDSVSKSSSHLYLQSYCFGEVQGMKNAIQLTTKTTQGVSSETTVLKSLSSMFIEELQQALKEGTKEQISSAMYKATALLITTEGVDRSLLYSVTQLPVRAFTEVAIATAIQCWSWMITTKPDLEYPFMREVAAVWKWTIEERKGIFSLPPGKSAKRMEKPPPVPVKQHLLLIKFLSNHFEVVKTRDAAQVSLIAEMLQQSLTLGVGPTSTQPQYLTHNPEATTARFRLLTLGVGLLHGNLISNSLGKTVLRERIYNATLDFFCGDPSWPIEDTATIREMVSALIRFWQSVKDLKNIAIAAPLPTSILEASTSLPRSSSSFWQLALSTESSAAQGSWLNTLSTSRGSRAASLSGSALQIPPPGHSRRSSTAAKNKVLLKRRNVILYLVRHEIERLSVWQNPGNLPELAIPGEDVVTNWVNPTHLDRHWQSTVIMAYHSSPHLAFQILNRFRNLDVVQKEVHRLIHSDPVAFVDIPDAAQCLAKKESVMQNVQELYHLLYWRNVPPASALIYFYKPFSYHPITAQFANKAMQSFDPDEILLYIPQLVQSLRYDKLGFAKAYILTAAKKSQLLAHQFLWNMEANMYMDEEGKQKDPEVGDQLEELSAEIQHGLTGAALKFYEREFFFFKKITNISGVIRPFPKPQRKQECLRALREVKLEPGVYLPSNPDSVVVEVDYKSGTPMQSAAKAPFLARFRVIKCGTAEVEKMNVRDERELSGYLSSKMESSIFQASIFKVGDDVRQDMLALQIIQLFKDVFGRVGLDLYLVPYRVVATASGCGVIECVPDSKSRDQLGKQTLVSLKEYFHSIYGDEDSVAYQQARGNFIKSMAAYSLVSYLLQIKDRHNGNIMVNKHGHIIHIDFGFLFESSPGGNLGFEPDLKLTEEMLELMGGKKSDPYRWFLDLCVRGYLALRPYQEQVVSLVCLMLDTGFPCFRRNTTEELRARFRPQLGEKEAAKAIIEVVESSCLNFRTYSYDVIQDVQQKIYYHKKTA